MSNTITNIADLRELARQRVPRMMFEFVDGGSYDEVTMRSNRSDLDALRLRPRVMVDVSRRSLGSTMLGQPVALPIALAPVGLVGLVRGDGEILAARAAQEAGIPFCLSTMSICTIEELRAALDRPFWFQLYIMKDRALARSLIGRARAAGCETLLLTVDLPLYGQRHRDLKNGLSAPPRMTLTNAIDIARRPAWALSVLRARRRSLGNFPDWGAIDHDASVTWEDLRWIRAEWPGKLVMKGIIDVDDARRALAGGVDALVVSNHGGRQLDAAPSSVAALPGIVDAVGDRVEVYFDSGVRSGQDILKALALGARACLIGRPFVYGLGALGEHGVRTAIGILRNELSTTMALTGLADVRTASRAMLWSG